jgi:fructose-1,6-bisphosphatase II
METSTLTNEPASGPNGGDEPGSAAPKSLRHLEPYALAATRAAALACQSWVGRGDKEAADNAATEAMREALASAPGTGRVVIGEGAKDDAPMLFDGEKVGDGDGSKFDIAVDPLECTTLAAKGLPSALATIAFAEAGSMADLGPAFYMDKLVGPPEVRGAVQLGDPPEENLARAAEALSKSVDQLRVVVLDKSRHEGLIEQIHAAGASVISPPDGDVGGALEALLPTGDADLLMGIGGTPEGVMTACAVRSLGGFMQAQLVPQSEDEEKAVAAADLSTERIYELDDLVDGDGLFVATGVTGGNLVREPWNSAGQTFTETIVVAAGCFRRVVEARPAASSTTADGDSEAGRGKGEEK